MHPDDLPRFISADQLIDILSMLPDGELELMKDFIFYSNLPFAVELRDKLKMHRATEWDAAIERQRKNSELARKFYGESGKGDMRRLAVLDPYFAQEFRIQHGNDVWSNPEKCEDTKKKEPRLFLE